MKPVDVELECIGAIERAFRQLDTEARERVLRWAMSFSRDPLRAWPRILAHNLTITRESIAEGKRLRGIK